MTESESPRPRTFLPGRSGDPLLAVIWILVLVLGYFAFQQRQLPREAPSSAGIQGRIVELQAFARDVQPLGPSPFVKLAAERLLPWDRALAGVLAAEAKEMELARKLALDGPEPHGAGEAFRRAFRAAYESGEPQESPSWPAVAKALGGGYGARLLEARLLERKGDLGAAKTLRETARRQAGLRLAVLAGFGLSALGLLFGGLAFGVFLVMTRKVPPRLELGSPSLDGRSLAWVFGIWGLALLLSGTLVAGTLKVLPPLKPFALFLGYGLHALVGVGLVAASQGLSLKRLLRRFGSPAPLRSLGWASGFLALAVTLVAVVGLALAPFLRSAQPPQRELMELIQGTDGILPVCFLFLTVAVVAPCFEELMFRGTLLPWLQARLGAPSAIPLSALAFAAIHLQPLATPTLFTLGVVLGLAARRTGGLLAPIAVHSVWNASVFLLMKVLS